MVMSRSVPRIFFRQWICAAIVVLPTASSARADQPAAGGLQAKSGFFRPSLDYANSSGVLRTLNAAGPQHQRSSQRHSAAFPCIDARARPQI
jgi:hypothetical protein